MPGELRDKLKLWETLNKILKNSGIVDITALEAVVSELKTKLNTLINDVLRVEHTINNIHNYDDTNLKDNLKEISDQINNIHTDINNITAKLNNITSTTTRLTLKNPMAVEIDALANEANDGTQALITTQFAQIVNKNDTASLYNSLTVGGRTTDSGCSLMSSNSISLTHRNLLHSVEVTANRNNISDVNGLVFSWNIY
jgi:seryl-tRNA synthetase